MVAFRNSDPSGRTSGLLLRCVLYSLLALGLIGIAASLLPAGRAASINPTEALRAE